MDTTVAGDVASPLALLGAKCVGAIGGSVISIAYLLPEGRREAATRFLIGLATGLVFGGPAGLLLADHLGFGQALGATETAVMGSAAASLSAWWALGALGRFADGLFRQRRRGGQP
ncbi:DUF6107 family protein [Aureimonas sp. AU4]|uniref:DUF6107 family protein n=1 Tax=Aureimonas sp. AU4 TaxID=1638163 RepID=UPI0007819DFC|nr:DUF6107 family protein [Aureimonas sp. AU4]